jgi:hypothetical protein
MVRRRSQAFRKSYSKPQHVADLAAHCHNLAQMEALLGRKVFIAVASAVGSILITLLTQQVLNRRGRFRYFVSHYSVGVSADDAIFGSVRVTWNDNPVLNLFSSTAELVNESMRDYANVRVRVFTSDTILLTERTEIVAQRTR